MTELLLGYAAGTFPVFIVAWLYGRGVKRGL